MMSHVVSDIFDHFNLFRGTIATVICLLSYRSNRVRRLLELLAEISRPFLPKHTFHGGSP